MIEMRGAKPADHRAENEFIRLNGFREHEWHLAIDDDQDPDTKKRYEFPYGDFKKSTVTEP